MFLKNLKGRCSNICCLVRNTTSGLHGYARRDITLVTRLRKITSINDSVLTSPYSSSLIFYPSYDDLIVYTGAVRPYMEYASSSWTTAAKTNTGKLDKIQNAGLVLITGGIKTTQISAMEKQDQLHSLE